MNTFWKLADTVYISKDTCLWDNSITMPIMQIYWIMYFENYTEFGDFMKINYFCQKS